MKLQSSRRITSRALAVLVLAALLMCLIPLLVMGHYDVPCADDYNYGVNTRAVLRSGGSFFQVLGAALQRTIVTYRIWQGSYSAVFLMCLQPSVFSESLYFLTPWLMLGSLLGGLICLSLVLFRRVLILPRSMAFIFAGTVGILWILLVPVPVQSFYWFNGSVYYTFYFGVSLAALALAVRHGQKGGHLVSLCLLGFFLGGGNLVTGLSLAILSVSSLLLLFFFRKREQAKRLLLPSLVLLACFLVNIAAPGNAIRALSVEHVPNAFGAIPDSFKAAFSYGLRWLRLPVIAALLFLALVFWELVPASSFSFRFPALVTLYSFCLYAAMFCPTMYAMGTAGDWRLTDIIFYGYLLLLAMNVLYWVGWFSRRRERQGEARPLSLRRVLVCLVLCLLCLGVSAKLTGGISLASAFTALRSGQAETYARENRERLLILHDETIRDAELEPYSDPPYLLFFDDITSDPKNWRNEGVQVFYDKDSVVLIGETRIPD